jgi:hypothetical protein
MELEGTIAGGGPPVFNTYSSTLLLSFNLIHLLFYCLLIYYTITAPWVPKISSNNFAEYRGLVKAISTQHDPNHYR